VNEPTRKIPAIAEKIKKLEARSDAIRRRLQVPCPTKYGNKEAANDFVRLSWPWHPLASPPADTATPSANEPEPTK
jgi:hypothetical protein